MGLSKIYSYFIDKPQNSLAVKTDQQGAINALELVSGNKNHKCGGECLTTMYSKTPFYHQTRVTIDYSKQSSVG